MLVIAYELDIHSRVRSCSRTVNAFKLTSNICIRSRSLFAFFCMRHSRLYASIRQMHVHESAVYDRRHWSHMSKGLSPFSAFSYRDVFLVCTVSFYLWLFSRRNFSIDASTRITIVRATRMLYLHDGRHDARPYSPIPRPSDIGIAYVRPLAIPCL